MKCSYCETSLEDYRYTYYECSKYCELGGL